MYQDRVGSLCTFLSVLLWSKTALKKSITRERERGETSNKIITGREDDSRGKFSLVLFLSVLEHWRKIFNVLNIPKLCHFPTTSTSLLELQS